MCERGGGFRPHVNTRHLRTARRCRNLFLRHEFDSRHRREVRSSKKHQKIPRRTQVSGLPYELRGANEVGRRFKSSIYSLLVEDLERRTKIMVRPCGCLTAPPLAHTRSGPRQNEPCPSGT